MNDNRIVAVALLTRGDLNALGANFDRAWPIDHSPAFSDLLRELDERTSGGSASGARKSGPVAGGGRY